MVIFRRSFFIGFLRTLTRSKMRFLSILAIIGLGVGFYAGINATEPDMIISADKYYQEQNLADFRIISPLGIKDDDMRQVRNLPEIQQIQPGYTQDLYLMSEDGSRSIVRLHSLNKNLDTEKMIDSPVLIAGRLPENTDEIVIDNGFGVPEEVVIGSKLRAFLPAGEVVSDILQNDEFTVVGIVMSPLYVNIDRGQTSIGDGSVDYYAFCPQVSFIHEHYSQLSLRTAASPDLAAYTDEYDRHLEEIKQSLHELGEKIIAAETEEMRQEITTNKTVLSEEKQLAQKELAAAEEELAAAERELELGETEIESREKQHRQEIDVGIKDLEEGRNELTAGKIQYFSNYALWLEGYNQYQDGRAELNSAKAQLDNAKNQIDQADRELDAAGQQLETARQQLDQMQEIIVALREVKETLNTGDSIDAEELENLIDQIGIFSPELAAAMKIYLEDPSADETQLLPLVTSILDWLEQEYATAEQEYNDGLASFNAGREKLDASKKEYESGLADYNAGVEEIAKAKAEIDQGKQELDAALTSIQENEAAISAAEIELEQAETVLDAEIAKAMDELNTAKAELTEARTRFNEEKKSVQAEIEQAENKIRDAERQLLEIPQQWFILTRYDNPGYADYGDDARRIGAVAKIFPLFFFLVAALVCFTTMTRMIEEERIQVGTMKAVGYNTLTISSKYLAYALIASLIGSVIGLLFGFNLLPRSIINAYALLYNIPYTLTPFHLNYAAFSIFVALLTVALAMMASIQELRATPAVLMQPRAPKPGKRILLERFEFFWSRLSFSHKLTARNIFRYKQRLLMTVIGIAGCTALLLTGFGLKDSVNAIMGKQFEEIFIYDAQLMIDNEQNQAEEKMLQLLDGHENITQYQKSHMESITIMPFAAGNTHNATLLVVDEPQDLHNFIDLHERVSRKPVPIGNDGAVITEKLAELIRVDAGDSLIFRDAQNRTYTIRVVGIAENYLTHYVYMSPEYFEQVTYRQPLFNSALFNLDDPQGIDQGLFQEELLANEFVLGSMLTLEIADEFSNTLGSLNYVVLILIISAGALAFVVLYNLININITERIREIATIKVLGFRDREVSMYVFREIIILTIIGTITGLFLGIVLHRFVMSTMEIDNMMFGKEIHWLSYVLSALLTLLFSVLVNIMMHFRLRKIKLAESMKSVE